MASASETSGPPPIDSTQSRTIAKAGIAATTAPKPTRLATLITGNTDAVAPASTVSRSAVSRLRLTAAASRSPGSARPSPTIRRSPTDRCAAQRSSARKLESRRGRMNIDTTRLTTITTSSGKPRSQRRASHRSCWPWRDFRRIELLAVDRALAKRRVVSSRVRGWRAQATRIPRRRGAPIFPRAPATTGRRPA